MKLEDILAARARIRRWIHKTPIMRSRQLEQLIGCELHFKCENLQKTGSFKARGVSNFLTSQTNKAAIYTTYSSGNHGQALAWGAREAGKHAIIFMPEDASPAKVAAVRGYGSQVVFAGLSSSDRFEACTAYAQKEGACVVPPYDNELIIAGQGTAMLEVLEEVPMFDAALLPVGGGGLLSGNAMVLAHQRSGSRVYACEPRLAADVQASLRSGTLQSIDYPATIADGLRNLSLGERNWAIVSRHVKEGLVCEEQTIRQVMALYGQFLKLMVEPSGAVSLACLWENRKRFAGARVIVYVSGGNIALPDYGKLVSQDELLTN